MMRGDSRIWGWNVSGLRGVGRNMRRKNWLKVVDVVRVVRSLRMKDRVALTGGGVGDVD